MHLFYVPAKNIAGNRALLSESEAHHAIHVLRMKCGEAITFTDGCGNEYRGKISQTLRKHAEIEILDILQHPKENELVLSLGLIKQKNRLEFAIEKAVEIGASEVVLFKSDYSEKTHINAAKIEAQIVGAMKQSLRFWKPGLLIASSFYEAAEHSSSYECFIAHEKLNADFLPVAGEFLQGRSVFVGPEGGFSDHEFSEAISRGMKPIWLGENRFRAETAAVSMLVLAKFGAF